MEVYDVPDEVDFIDKFNRRLRWGWLFRILRRPKTWIIVGLFAGVYVGGLLLLLR